MSNSDITQITVTIGCGRDDSEETVIEYAPALEEAIQAAYPDANVVVNTDFRTNLICKIEIETDDDSVYFDDRNDKEYIAAIHAKLWESGDF